MSTYMGKIPERNVIELNKDYDKNDVTIKASNDVDLQKNDMPRKKKRHPEARDERTVKRHRKKTANGSAKKRTNKNSGKKSRRRRRKKQVSPIKILLIICTVIVACILAAAGTAFLIYSHGKSKLMEANETSIIKGDETEEKLKSNSKFEWQSNWIALNNQIYEYDTETINLLFLGIDTRGKMKKETDLSPGADPGQADAIFVLSLNEKNGKVKIVGVPRNALIVADKYDENGDIKETVEDQICLQYPWAGGGLFGMERTKEKVSEILYGIPIHGMFALSYDSVPIVNDMVGGVDIKVIEDLTFYDEKFVPGAKIHLMGNDATTYIQRRDINKVGSPTGRLKRQRQYILELFKQTKDQIKANPTMINSIYKALDGYMLTDIGLDEAMYLATKVLKCGFDSKDMYIIDGEDIMVVNTKIKESQQDKIKNQFNDYALSKESIDEIMTSVFLNPVDTKIFSNE